MLIRISYNKIFLLFLVVVFIFICFRSFLVDRYYFKDIAQCNMSSFGDVCNILPSDSKNIEVFFFVESNVLFLHFLSSFNNYFDNDKIGKANNSGIDFFIRSSTVKTLSLDKDCYILNNNLYIGENRKFLNKTEFLLALVDKRYGNIESMCNIL